MSLIDDSKRAEAGRIMTLHQTAIDHHVNQIKLLKAEIETIKANFPDDTEEVDSVLLSISEKVGAIK